MDTSWKKNTKMKNTTYIEMYTSRKKNTKMKNTTTMRICRITPGYLQNHDQDKKV